MTSPYYSVSGAPTAQSRGNSQTLRTEFLSLQTGFDRAYTDIQSLAATIGAGTTTAEVSLASATTTTIGSASGNVISITGTNTISSFGTTYNGVKYLRFTGSLTLVNSATLVLPNGVNITTAAGDACIAIPIGNPATGWRVENYERLAGSITPTSISTGAVTSSGIFTSTLASGTVFNAGSATTGGLALSLANSGNTAYFGLESSAGGAYITGSTPNAMVLRSVGTIQFSANNGASANLSITNTGINNTPIGSTTPSTGAFTTLSASSLATASGGSFNGANQPSSGQSVEIVYNSGGYVTSYDRTGVSYQPLNLRGSVVNTLANGSNITTVSSTGLAVTGALSATGSITSTGSKFQSTITGGGVALQMGNTFNTVSIGSIQNAVSDADLAFYTQTSTERMRLDYQGNLGIGVTPSAWVGGFRVVELNGGSFAATGNGPYINTNCAYVGAGVWQYKTTNPASQYQQLAGTHIWNNAASGTAGTTITFTQAMLLDVSGNLGLGVTPDVKLHVYSSAGQTVKVTGATGAQTLLMGNQDSAGASNPSAITAANGIWYFGKGSSWTGGGGTLTYNMTLDNSGNLGVGVTPSAWWTGGKAVELTQGAALYSLTNTTNTIQNAYYNGANWIYKATAAAALAQVTQGQHILFTAPSGTAGNTISFTQSLAVGKGTALTLEGATSTAGTGIAFPATANLSTDPNTLDQYSENFYTATLTGCTTAPTFAISYTIIGNVVHMTLPTLTATSNATTCTLTGAPSAVFPAAQRFVSCTVQDNSGSTIFGLAVIETTGVITLYTSAAQAVFTASGTKGIKSCSISYRL